MKDWMIQAALGLVITIIGFFLKGFKSDVDAQKIKVESLNEDFYKYKLMVSEHYVSKEDFIRAMATTDRKLDKIYDEILKINSTPRRDEARQQ